MLNVAILEPSFAVTQGIRTIIDGNAKVKGIFSKLSSLSLFVDCDDVDFVIMELSSGTMSFFDGIDFIISQKQLRPGIRFLVFTEMANPAILSMLISMSPISLVSKQDSVETINEAIQHGYNRRTYISPFINSLLGDKPLRIGGRLSKKEWQVLSLTAKEYSATEISGICKISAKTVYGHKRNIMKKMGLYNHIQFSKMICDHSSGWR